MKVINYIIAHDINLIDNKSLPNNTHVILVGNNYRNIEENYILCRNLPYNIENYPYLCSYTGWYAISENKLANNYDIVTLLEYDTDIHELFNNYNKQIIDQQKDNDYIIGYSKTLTNHYVFYKSTPWLEISLEKVYNINLKNFIKKHKDNYLFWPTTTNFTIPLNILNDFVKWFNPLCEIFRHDPLGSYVHERAFFIYCVLNSIRIIQAPDYLIKHHQSQSHKIQDIYGQVLNIYGKSCLTNDMTPIYDMIYANKAAEFLSQI